jgi:hypothetical protein
LRYPRKNVYSLVHLLFGRTVHFVCAWSFEKYTYNHTVLLRCRLGFSGNDDKKGLDCEITGASHRTYLPHGACKRCAARQDKQSAQKIKDGRHFGNDIIHTADTKTNAVTRLEALTRKANGFCESELEKSTDGREQTSELKRNVNLSASCSGNHDVKHSANMDNKNRTNKRHLSKMSKDCASINRSLLDVVKENMRRNSHKLESPCS